jgi:uncharacterized Zn finger protein
VSTVEPLECPRCLAHLVVLSPEWKDGAPTGKQLAECRSCGPVNLKAVEKAAKEDPRVVEQADDSPARVSDSEPTEKAPAKRTTMKKA